MIVLGITQKGHVRNLKRRRVTSRKSTLLSWEEDGDLEFAKSLSELGDIYINDAFGTAHRNHASTGILPSFFKAAKRWGFCFQEK